MTHELHEKILEELNLKISYLQEIIDDLRTSNNETKSSMGDKYETSREMVQQEIVRVQNQQNETLTQRDFFQKINIKQHESIVLGSYIETSMGNFCIAISLGEINYQNKKVFVLSPQTPLGQNLLGKKMGDTFQINGKTFEVFKVE